MSQTSEPRSKGRISHGGERCLFNVLKSFAQADSEVKPVRVSKCFLAQRPPPPPSLTTDGSQRSLVWKSGVQMDTGGGSKSWALWHGAEPEERVWTIRVVLQLYWAARRTLMDVVYSDGRTFVVLELDVKNVVKFLYFGNTVHQHQTLLPLIFIF